MIPQDNQHRTTVYLCKRLFNEHVRPYLKQFVIAFLCMTAVSVMTGLQAKLIEPLIDEIFVAQNRDVLFIVSGLIILVAAFKGACSFGTQYLTRYLGTAVTIDIQKRLYRHLIRHDYAFITGESSGQMLSRFTNDVGTLRGAVSTLMTSLIRETLTLIVLIGLMFHQSMEFALITFCIFPIAVYPVLRLGKRMRKVSVSVQRELGLYTARLAESLHNIIVIKTSCGEQRETDKAESKLNDLLGYYRKAARTHALSSPIMETLGGVATASVVLYGGLMVMEGETTPGKFTSFLTALIMAYKPMKSLSSLNTVLQEAMAAAVRVFALLDAQPTLNTDKNTAKLPACLSGDTNLPHISFRNVSFSYGGERVLHDVSFDIPFGKTVALVGSSGGGKSSLLHLLMRLYAPEQGSIHINGVDTLSASQESLYSHIAYVSQKVMLFDDSVAGNIAYAVDDASDQDIKDAATRAAADEFINALPQQYATMLGEDGNTLSGGQRQRIAIARALIRNTPLLIMDEATSALDTVSERVIRNALERDKGARTVIIVAHRLSSIRHADHIIVMDRGRIAEQGTHEDLFAKPDGIYRTLHASGDLTEE